MEKIKYSVYALNIFQRKLDHSYSISDAIAVQDEFRERLCTMNEDKEGNIIS